MSNINNELSELLKGIFFEELENIYEYVPIIRNSKNITKIIPFFLTHSKNNEEDMNSIINLVNLLQKFFKINNNLIPLFMNNNFYAIGKTFYECLIKLYLEEYICEENKLFIEELMKTININYSISKNIIETIYQNLSQYLRNCGKNILTQSLLGRYLNLLSLMYSDPYSIIEDKEQNQIQNYIYFNGIDSQLSFVLNKFSNNHISDFPTLEKGFSVVFWIKLDFKLINEYFKILDDNIDINLIKINIGGELLIVKLIDPKSIIIANKEFSTKIIEIDKIFNYDDWNNIIFTVEKKKNKLLTKLYINNNQIDNFVYFTEKINWKEKINNIDLFENLLGKVSSILFFSFVIDMDLIIFFSTIKGFYKKKLVKDFLFLIDKEYSYLNYTKKTDNKSNTKINNKLKLKLKDHNINNLICFFCPFTFDKYKNTIDDVFGNFICKLGINDGVNFYKNKSKDIQSLGGIHNLLPIMEIMFSSLKKENPYNAIDINIFNEKNFLSFLIIIQKILYAEKTSKIYEKETKFFSSLSIFLEKIPSRYYTMNILQNILNIINISLSKDETKRKQNACQLIKLLILNENIILKFPKNLHIELWDNIYNILTKNIDLIKNTLNTTKICLFIKFYDEERYTKFCCKQHASFLNEKQANSNLKYLMNPELNLRINKLFNIIQFYIDNSKEDKIFKDIFKLLTLDLSPCLQNKIILLYITHFSNEKIDAEIKKKTLYNLLKNNFIDISEYVLKISLLDTRIYIFKLFNLFTTNYKKTIYEYFKQNSLSVSEIVQFFSLNIFPTNIIIEVDKNDEAFFVKEKQKLFLPKEKIKKFNKILDERNLNKDNKYISLIDILNKEEYNKNIDNIWNFFISSFKFVPKEFINNKIRAKNRKMMINPFILNFLVYYVSGASPFHIAQFLIEILSDLKDDSIVNRNIFYNSKRFFPWILDTIFYFHNTKIEETFDDKEMLNTIKSISIKVISDLFSHRREKDEIFKNLNYILEYSKYYQNMGKKEDVEEILKITRFILLKIFEYSDVNIDIKSKIIFEFMILFKNSENIFKEESIIFKEISALQDKEFFENNVLESVGSNNWQEISNNNNIKNNKNEINENIDLDKNEESEDNNINIIEDVNESESKETKINFPSNETKNSIMFGANDLIPNYFYEGINYNDDIKSNKNERLENFWNDFQLFIGINEYYKNKLWGLKNFCKNSKKITNNMKDEDFSKLVKKLLNVYGDKKENKNILIKRILKYVYFNKENKKYINVLYLNIILLSIAIDISENDNEKKALFFDYQQFLLFFILASINISQNTEIRDKSNNKIISLIYNFLYNIIGYGFTFLKKRDSQKYEKFKNNLIKPIFEIDSKIIFGYSKKTFFKNSIIGKLFTLKDMGANDDINISINLKQGKENKKHSRITTDLNMSVMLVEGGKGRKLKLSQTVEDGSDIYLRAVPSKIIKEIIEETVNIYKREKALIPKNQILLFYEMRNLNEHKDKINCFLDKLNENDLMEKTEKRIENVINQIIKELNNQKNQYQNKSCLKQLIHKKDYKKIKKLLFSWNGFWCDKNLFYKHPEYLKLHIKNHFTKDMTKVLLTPILDMDYYLPKFKLFDKNKLFNKDDYKYNIILNIDEILKLDEENEKKEELEDEMERIDKNIININNEMNSNQKKDSENNEEILKNEIVIHDEDIEKNKIVFNNNKPTNLNIMPNISNKNGIQEIMKKDQLNNREIDSSEQKEIIIKKIHRPSKIINNSTKNIFYLNSLYKFSFKGILEKYKDFHKSIINFGKSNLSDKDTFDLLIQKKLTSSKNVSKYENIYKCCIVKPTHHIKGYISTESEYAKFIYYEDDEESEKLLQEDISYDKELHCCFGSTFKKHIKDKEKANMKIYYKDIKYILNRNYFYQETAVELYTFSNKSYLLNFMNNKEMQKFRDDFLNHDIFRKIIGKDSYGKKILGFEKSFESKSKILKIKEIMKEWKNNNISTLRYLMYLNIFSGRSLNDMTQYPILPWIITNYHNEEITSENFRDLSIPIGMLDFNEKSRNRKEIFLEFYETLKNDFKEANEDFNYKEYLIKGEEYLEQYKIKKNKKKRGSKIEQGLEEINICKIEINQIPFFYGTHYSCPAFVSHFLMRVFPFSLISIEIQGNKFDDPDRIFISIERTFESTSSLKDDIRELIPEFYTLPEMFLNKNNLNLTQNKLDSEGKKIIVNDVELPPWCNNQSYNFISELRRNLEKNDLNINKWIDLVFGYLQRGEKAEDHHNIFMAQSYENMVKIDKIADIDERNALMRLVEVGITPRQIFKKETSQRNERASRKWKYLYESKKLFMFSIIIPKYDNISKNIIKTNNKENNNYNFPKITKIKYIGINEVLLINELNIVNKIKFKNTADKFIIEEKEYFQISNVSSEYSPSFIISSVNCPIILYNNNKYMIKGGFWDGRLEINSLTMDLKDKSYLKNIIYVKEGPIIIMEMTEDEKILICGTKTGYLICFSVNGLFLNIIKKIYYHFDEITSININDNLNMFSSSSLDGYVNLYILPSFELVRSLKVCNTNSKPYYEDESNFDYANNVFLSSSPLASITIFISSKRIFRSFTINGEFIEDLQETNNSNYIKSPIIFHDLDFQEYLIYGTDDGRIKIRKFPNMELINSVCPGDGNEILSMDISVDKKYCYIWMENNKIYIIKDLYTDSGKDKKQIIKIDKELEKENKEND